MTNGRGITKGVMEANGQFNLYTASGVSWSTTWSVTGTTNARAMIQDDGQFAVWEGTTSRWVSGSVSSCVTTVPTCGTPSPFSTFRVIDLQYHALKAGQNFDGNPEYVGFGDNPNCGEYPAAGFVVPAGPKGAGAYMSCNVGQSFDNVNASFLIDSTKYRWMMSTSATVMSDSTALVLHGNRDWRYGRVFYNGAYRVTKIHPNTNLYMIDETGAEKSFSNFEVLTCGAPTSGDCDDTIISGQVIDLGYTRYSCKGCFKLTLQTDGNLVTNFQVQFFVFISNFLFYRLCIRTLILTRQFGRVEQMVEELSKV